MSDHVSDEQLSLLIDSELSLAAREAVIEHVRHCPTCAERHDRLVELVASLRVQQPLAWSTAHTHATLARLQSRAGRYRRRRPRFANRRHDWSLPLASVLALVGMLALTLAPLGVAATITHAPAAAFAALLPDGALVSGRLLAGLAAAVVLGLLAFPLSRSR
jgi:anti-sigma factor RsiW